MALRTNGGATFSPTSLVGGATHNLTSPKHNSPHHQQYPNKFGGGMKHQQNQASLSYKIPSKRVVIRDEKAQANSVERYSATGGKRPEGSLELPRVSSASTVSANTMVNLMYLEDFDSEIDPLFISEELKPYFLGVFQDLALRSTQSQSNPSLTAIDKVTFVEYINLPGIVSDRFHALATQGRSDGRVLQESFISLMLQVYSSSLDEKMQLTFKM